MRILQLCLKPPQPAKDGGCIAINNISKGLIDLGVDLKILTLSTHKHPFDINAFSDEFVNRSNIEAVFIDTKLNIVDAFSNLVTADSYNVSRFFSTDFDILLRKTLEASEYDVVHLESLFMTTYCHTIRRFSKAKIVLRSHNLEHMIWERMANQSTNPAKKVYLKLLAKQLREYEINTLNSIDGIASITDEDGDKYKNLGCTKPIMTVPFGVQLSDYKFIDPKTTQDLKLFHLGAMDWKPNIEGVAWFLEEIWIPLQEKHPELILNIAGRNMPEWLMQSNYNNVNNLGEVTSSSQFINDNNVMIVPLLSAGGMRVKIIEGMALGKVILSTSIGAEGIEFIDRENILIANTLEEHINQIEWLLEDPNRIITIGTNARYLVEKKYDNEIIIKNLYGFYTDLVTLK